jgi:hypothetical protein
LSGARSTKEHVIGRRFVPKGTLNKNWNLIVRACVGCNGLKSDLEDDLSALTMQPDGLGRFPGDDALIKAEAHRKAAKSISRRTKKLVKDSVESLSITAPMGPTLRMSATFTAPPQPDEERAFRLARMHITAFFYWVTYDPTAQVGHYWPGVFMTLNAALRADWGNAWQRSFATAVMSWEPRVFIRTSASTYFAVMIRRHPVAACWSWALEWNRSYRLIGFFGDRDAAFSIVERFPKPVAHVVHRDEHRTVVLRPEIGLSEEEDCLFAYDGPIAES